MSAVSVLLMVLIRHLVLTATRSSWVLNVLLPIAIDALFDALDLIAPHHAFPMVVASTDRAPFPMSLLLSPEEPLM